MAVASLPIPESAAPPSAASLRAGLFRQAQNKIKSRVVLGSERPRNRLFNVGGNWMQRSEYRSVADDLAAVDAVTLDDVHRVLVQYPLTRSTTVTIGPLADWDRR